VFSKKSNALNTFAVFSATAWKKVVKFVNWWCH